MTQTASVNPEVAFAAYPGILAFYAMLQDKQKAGNESLQIGFSSEKLRMRFKFGQVERETGKAVLTSLKDFEQRIPVMVAWPSEIIVEFNALCAEVAESEAHPEAKKRVVLPPDF